MSSRLLFDPKRLQITIDRLCFEIKENHPNFDNTCLIGIQPRGIRLARMIKKNLIQQYKDVNFKYGEIDVTFHRDDYRTHETPLLPNNNQIDFTVESQNVILIDDVLYTGRTIRAAFDALLTLGRPSSVELLILVDRKRLRQFPIEANYIGIQVDTIAKEKVIVDWPNDEDLGSIYINSTQ